MPLDLGDTYRRLPIYFLIDTSGSMAGPPITAVNEGLKIFQELIRNDEQCRETVHAGVLRFASSAEQMSPLTEAVKFTAPLLTAEGGTALSLGFKLLRETLFKELRPKTGDYPGDHKAQVFLFTDGEPNTHDGWKAELDLLQQQKGRRPSIVAIGAGPEVRMPILKQIAPESNYLLADLDSAKIKKLFEWIGNSTIVASRAAGQDVGQGQQLAPAPTNLFAASP